MNVLLRTTILALSGMAFLSACKGKSEEAAKAKPAPSVPGWIARDTVVSRELIGSGSILADAVVDLRSELAARVEAVGFREGQDVKAGQLLVKFASQDLQASRDKARANVDFAKATLERKRQQFSSQSVSQQELDQATQALASAQADLATGQAMLAKSEIRAPFSGKVGTSNVAVGQFLSVGQVLATVAKVRPLKVEFQVPGDDVAKVRPGMPLLFKPFGKGDFREAKITAADAVLDTLSRTLRVRAAWTGDTKGLIPGAAVEIRIPLGKEPVFLLPPQALGSEGKVLLLRGGKATVQKVMVGRRTADAVEVQGLTKGDTVLCNGAVSVKPGSAVKPSRFL